MHDVFFDNTRVGEADDWIDADIALFDHAEKLFGDQYRDGRNATAVRVAAHDEFLTRCGHDPSQPWPTDFRKRAEFGFLYLSRPGAVLTG